MFRFTSSRRAWARPLLDEAMLSVSLKLKAVVSVDLRQRVKLMGRGSLPIKQNWLDRKKKETLHPWIMHPFIRTSQFQTGQSACRLV